MATINTATSQNSIEIDTLGWGKYFLSFFNKKVEKFKGVSIQTRVYLRGKDVILKSFISTHCRCRGDNEYTDNELGVLAKEYSGGKGSRIEVIGTIPFVPTISIEKGSAGCTWYRVSQLSKEDNESLNLCYSWNGGKDYSKKWNQDSKYAWCSFFFKDAL